MEHQPKYIVAVASGKGGVGNHRHHEPGPRPEGPGAGLLDADIYGPSQRRMLGVAAEVKPEQQDENGCCPSMSPNQGHVHGVPH